MLHSRWLKAVSLLLVCGTFLTAFGCVERELYLLTDPPQATVWVSGKERGKTPIAIPFDYYGERLVELRLRGYRVKRAILSASPPWYQIFPLDLFFDLCWPGTLKDTHVFSFFLEPYAPQDLDEKPAILDRADTLRKDVL